MPDLAAQAAALRSLHRPGDPLLLPNVWDVAGAKMVAELGYPAVATSSTAVAQAFGQPDADSMETDIAFGVVERIARAVEVPVTGDLEAGYQLSAEEFVRRLLAAGGVGCNLEDSDHHGPNVLLDKEVAAERI